MSVVTISAPHLLAFGASAPLTHLQTKSGFTPEAVVGAATARMNAAAGR